MTTRFTLSLLKSISSFFFMLTYARLRHLCSMKEVTGDSHRVFLLHQKFVHNLGVEFFSSSVVQQFSAVKHNETVKIFSSFILFMGLKKKLNVPAESDISAEHFQWKTFHVAMPWIRQNFSTLTFVRVVRYKTIILLSLLAKQSPNLSRTAIKDCF